MCGNIAQINDDDDDISIYYRQHPFIVNIFKVIV